MGQRIGKAVERVAKERHKLPRQRQMLPRNSKGIQPWRKSFSFAGGMVGTPDCLFARLMVADRTKKRMSNK